MDKYKVDYSVYLVTDSTEAVLGARNAARGVVSVVADAVRGSGGDGGVSSAATVGIVQLRDKTADTATLVAEARALHAVLRPQGIPLLVNDRVDVALAAGCDGVHIGQDDMDLATARRLLGDDKIIGVTVSNVEEMRAAVEGGADYLGIGTVFSTQTKENTKSIIGVDGLQQILQQIPADSPVKTVCIGGINASNASRVVWQSGDPSGRGRSLDGVAVVSAIMGAADPAAASRELLRLVKTPPAFARHAPPASFLEATATATAPPPNPAELVGRTPGFVRAVEAAHPLSHNMTNLVVQNLAANVALAAGASPIMANYAEEAADIARLGGALVINMGTVTPDGLSNYLQALRAYNDAGRPVVFDPVGSGATAVRRAATKTIIGSGYIDVLKGNQSEILSCIAVGGGGDPAAPAPQQRGVDSGPSDGDARKLGAAARALAVQRKNVVVMTGKTDYITAGGAVLAVDNGHEYLGMVTGTGCCLGTTISAYVAAATPAAEGADDEEGNRGEKDGDRNHRLAAVLAAVLHYSIAAELAAERDDVRGPGTFVPAFLDELCNVRKATVYGDLEWLKRAKVSVLPID